MAMAGRAFPVRYGRAGEKQETTASWVSTSFSVIGLHQNHQIHLERYAARGDFLHLPLLFDDPDIGSPKRTDRQGTWVTERRNVLSDYRQLYGEVDKPR